MEATLGLARSLDHAFTLAQTLVIAARLYHYMGDVGRVRRVIEEANDISSHHGFPLFVAEATVWSGWADVMENSEALRAYAQERGALFDPMYGDEALAAAIPSVAHQAYTLFDGGKAAKDPASVGIERP